MIATDHAPHSREEKSKGLKSLNGIVGLECSFPILYTKLVKNNVISLEKLIELMSLNPARRFGFEQKNCYCVYSLDEQYRINPEQFASMGRSTPFKNEKVFGKCIATICNGELAYIDSGLIDRS